MWQERPTIIIMLTNLKEDNKKKCEQYWPDNGSENFGPFKVTLTVYEDCNYYCIRRMQVIVSTIATVEAYKLQLLSLLSLLVGT